MFLYTCQEIGNFRRYEPHHLRKLYVPLRVVSLREIRDIRLLFYTLRLGIFLSRPCLKTTDHSLLLPL